MKNTARQNPLATITETQYGVNALQCDAIVIEWACDVMLKTESPATVKQALRALNSKRSGKYNYAPRYGQALFNA
jgi:hypothetical protein